MKTSRQSPNLIGLFFCFVLIGSLMHDSAYGHTLSRSFSLWKVEADELSVQVTLDAKDISGMKADLKGLHAVEIARDPEDRKWILELLKNNLFPGTLRTTCTALPGDVFAINTDTLIANWVYKCPESSERTVTSQLHRVRGAEHLHFITWRDQERTLEAILSSSKPNISFAQIPQASGIKEFIDVGFEHVLEGYDHILFVLALVILGGTLWSNILLATGFTAGHSITLALASLGIVQVQAALVEILVAISVAFAGLFYFHSALQPRRNGATFGLNLLIHALTLYGTTSIPGATTAILGSAVFTSCLLSANHWGTLKHQLLIALSFGLIHGFAFANAFGELLQGSSLVLELLGFNIGVEIGQISVVLIAAFFLALVRRSKQQNFQRWLTSATAGFIFAMGIQWTFTRLLQL